MDLRLFGNFHPEEVGKNVDVSPTSLEVFRMGFVFLS
jgi:hypothetical protein